jgi:hypothetical protein
MKKRKYLIAEAPAGFQTIRARSLRGLRVYWKFLRANARWIENGPVWSYRVVRTNAAGFPHFSRQRRLYEEN